MANSLTQLYRKYLADTGQTDDRDDFFITQELGEWAQRSRPGLLQAFPDFGQEWGSIREANAPSLGGEFVRGVKRAGLGLGSTAAGAVSLFTDSDYFRQKAQELEERAAAPELAATVPTMEDISPGETGVRSVVDRDTLRYGISKLGEAAPSIGEAVVTAGAGALAGTTAAPGPGTVAGGAAGLLGRSAVKAGIREMLKRSAAEGAESLAEGLVRRGVLNEATEEAIESAVRAGVRPVVQAVTQNARRISALRGGQAAAAANSYGLSAGEIYNETDDRELALGLGVVAALPDTILPNYLLRRMFPGVALAEAKEQGKNMVVRLGREALTTSGIEAGTEGFQESVNIVARNLKEGRDPLDFRPEDWRRVREAAVTGVAGGLLVAPAAAVGGSAPRVDATVPQTPAQTPPRPVVAPAAPVVAPAVGPRALNSRIAKMAPEQQAARLAELTALPTRNAAQERELVVLQQVVRPVAPAATPAARFTPMGVPLNREEREAQLRDTLGAVTPLAPSGKSAAESAETFMANVPGATSAEVDLQRQAALAEQQRFETARTLALPAELAALEEARRTESPAEVAAHEQAIFDRARAAGIEFSLPRQMVGENPAPEVDLIAPAGQSQSALIPEIATPAELPPVSPPVSSPVANPAPAVFAGVQEGIPGRIPDREIFTLTADIPGHPEGSTVFRQTLEAAGYQIPPQNTGETQDALPQRTPEEVFQREPSPTGAVGSERGGVESIIPGPEATGTQEVVESGGTPTPPVGETVAGGVVPERAVQEPRALKGKAYLDEVRRIEKEAASRKPETETIIPSNDTVLGKNDAGETIYQRKDGSVYRMRFDSPRTRPNGYPDFGGDLSVVEPRTSSAELRLNNAGIDLPPVSSLSAKQKLAELQAGGVTTYKGKPIEDANPAQLSAALGQFRRGELNTDGTPVMRTAPAPNALEATRTREFQTVFARLMANGANVQALTQEFLAQSIADTLNQQIADLTQRIANATPPQRVELQRQLTQREDRLAELQQAQGVTFSPWQIAVAVDDVSNASVDNLVTLLHEAAESLQMRLTPAMQGAVYRGVVAATAEMNAAMQSAAKNSGATVANVPNPSELLAETLAQKLADEGIQDAPSLAQAIVRWIKDLYYRSAMALQRAFGAEPSGELATAWFENQLRRELGGDFDYRIASVFNRLVPPSNQERVSQLDPAVGTPGNAADFLDPITSQVRQPWVEPTSEAGDEWNMRFRTVDPDTGAPEGIPYDEAVARQTAAGLNEVIAWMQEQHRLLAPDMDFEVFQRQFGRGTKTPTQMLSAIAQRQPGAETARIGGERMTDAMNKWAAQQALTYLYRLRQKHLTTVAKLKTDIAEAEDDFSAAASQLNRSEANVRDAQLHEAQLKDKARKMMRDVTRSYRNGLKTSTRLGQLIAEEEVDIANDPLPAYYEQVFNTLADGGIPLFEYIEALAMLDLPLEQMTPQQVWKSIRDNADSSPALKRLTQNKPLGLTIAAMATEISRQIDQIQLRREGVESYRNIKQELDNIRNATEAEVRAMIAALDSKSEAKGLRQRLRAAYLKERAALQRQSARISAAEERVDMLEAAKPAVDEKVSEMEQAVGGIFSDWTPVGGAKFSAMRLQDDGTWKRVERTLEFNPDGSAVNAAQVESDLAQNRQWLRENQSKLGQKFYNEVKQQTESLGMLNVSRAYPAANFGKIMGFIDSMVRPLQAIAKQAGHSAGSRIGQQFNQYAFIMRFADQFDVLSRRWTNTFQALQKTTGIKDNGRFLTDVYNPVMFFLGTNPGLEEAQAIRAATKQARALLPTQPGPEFDDQFARFLRQTKEVNDELLKLAEQFKVFVADPKLGNELRKALDRGWLTGMRSMDGSVVGTLLRDMQNAGWKITDGTGVTFEALDPANAATPEERAEFYSQTDNTDALRAALAPLFTPRIINDWLAPFINKPGEPVFRYQGQPISQLDAQAAWANANGDVVQWIDNLGQIIGVQPDPNEDASPASLFRVSILRQLDRLYAFESKLAADANVSPDLFDGAMTKPHVMMDARLNDLLPPEHVKFAGYDPTSTRQLLGQIAFHGAFGRNGAGLVANLRELENVLAAKKQAFDSLTGTTVDERKRQAAERGLDYNDLQGAVKRYDSVIDLKSKVEGALGTKNYGSALHDPRAALEVLGFMVGQAVDRPTTAGLNLLSLGQRPFAQHSLGPLALKGTAAAYGDFLKSGFGDFLRSFGIDLVRQSEYEKDIGAVEGRALRSESWGVALSDIGKDGRFQESGWDNYLIRPLRTLRAIQRKGVGAGPVAIPGLGIMSRVQAQAASSNTIGNIKQLEQLISRGIQYFSTHPEDAANPAFRFDHETLGLRSWDKGAFEWLRDKVVEYNMGTLESIVRGAIPAQAAGERLLTRDQVLKVAEMTSQELDGASSINTTPASLYGNPVLQFAMPLLRWPLWMMHSAHNAMADADGQRNYKTMLRGLGTIAAWNLPLALAFTFMLDEYEEKLMGRKNALPDAEGVGAVPIVGPALALATTDKTIPKELLAMGQRLMRAGNVYGLGADLAGQFIAPFDPASGQRAFSLDQRVLVMSQLLNIQQAMRNLVAQGGDATWGSVWRPFLNSIGGNGVLHSLDLVNSAASLDNAESRMMRRVNAQRWVNAAAREIGLETRGVGTFGTPTPVSVWTREMFTAAMANDRVGFTDAYQRALAASRRAVGNDPTVSPGEREKEASDRVLKSWRSRNPFSWLPTRPSEQQWREMLGTMSDQGRADVQDAVRRYDQFTQFIAPSQSERMIERRMRSQQPPTAEVLRRRMAGSMMMGVP